MSSVVRLNVCKIFKLTKSQGFVGYAVLYILIVPLLMLLVFGLPYLYDRSCVVEYCKDGQETESCQSEVALYADTLESEETVVPYEYSDFDFCTASSPVTNLFQKVFGERSRLSSYNITFLKEVRCAPLCRKVYHKNNRNDMNKLNKLKKGMLKNYQHHWIVDNMPITWCFTVVGSQQFCSTGFPIGCYVNSAGWPKDACVMNINFQHPDTFYVFNHVDIAIAYHSGSEESWGVGFKNNSGRIVSIKIQPRSIKHQSPANCGANLPPMDIPSNFDELDNITINYTYSVNFVLNNNVKWSRWDYILELIPYSDIQWYSIFISFAIVLLLAGVVVKIMLQMSKDVAHQNQIKSGDDAQKQCCMLVSSDVFGPPLSGKLLSFILGNGVQVFFVTLIALFLACLGLFSSSNTSFMIAFVTVLYISFSPVASCISVKMYKDFSGKDSMGNAFLTAIVCPGCLFLLFLVIQVLFSKEGSSATSLFIILLILAVAGFGYSLPLSIVVAVIATEKSTNEPFVKTNEKPRLIPKRGIYTRTILGIMMGGILPFSCIFIQLFFILNSVWLDQVYIRYGILFLVFILLILTCVETAVLLCYFNLRARDYHWCWRSFLCCGISGVYVFAYLTYYFFVKLNVTPAVSVFLYFVYSFYVAFWFFLLTGCVGFFGCFWFLRKVYSHQRQNLNRKTDLFVHSCKCIENCKFSKLMNKEDSNPATIPFIYNANKY